MPTGTNRQENRRADPQTRNQTPTIPIPQKNDWDGLLRALLAIKRILEQSGAQKFIEIERAVTTCNMVGTLQDDGETVHTTISHITHLKWIDRATGSTITWDCQTGGPANNSPCPGC